MGANGELRTRSKRMERTKRTKRKHISTCKPSSSWHPENWALLRHTCSPLNHEPLSLVLQYTSTTSNPLPSPKMSRSFTTSNKYPTLRQILFSPHTPYVPPKASPLAMLVWRWRIWFESTFGLVCMEPWEKCVVGRFICRPRICVGRVHLDPSGLIPYSGFPLPCVRLYDPCRTGCTQSVVLDLIRIQIKDLLHPRYGRTTKQHFPSFVRKTPRLHLLLRFLFRFVQRKRGEEREGNRERETEITWVYLVFAAMPGGGAVSFLRFCCHLQDLHSKAVLLYNKL